MKRGCRCFPPRRPYTKIGPTVEMLDWIVAEHSVVGLTVERFGMLSTDHGVFGDNSKTQTKPRSSQTRHLDQVTSRQCLPLFPNRALSASFGRNQTCATGSASVSFHDQKTVITVYRWTALAEPNSVRRTFLNSVVAHVWHWLCQCSPSPQQTNALAEPNSVRARKRGQEKGSGTNSQMARRVLRTIGS